jgi:hypothetical protein
MAVVMVVDEGYNDDGSILDPGYGCSPAPLNSPIPLVLENDRANMGFDRAKQTFAMPKRPILHSYMKMKNMCRR